MDAEFRFRFIAKGGMLYPNPAVSIKGLDENRHKFKILKKSAVELYNEVAQDMLNKVFSGQITYDEYQHFIDTVTPADFKDQVVHNAAETSWNGLK